MLLSYTLFAEAAAFTMQPENIANMPPVDSEFAHTIAETLKVIYIEHLITKYLNNII